jgi:flavorubredoxin
MYKTITINERVDLLTANDRRTNLFENLWPLEKGVSYNSYLIVDEKVALIDTIEKSKIEDFLDLIEKKIGKDRKVDYLVVNHMEPDHSAGIKSITERYPDVKIVGNKMTFSLIKGFFGITNNLHLVEDGNTISLGETKLKFFITPWVHWPETMMTYDETHQILFSGDAFGSFGSHDGGVFNDEVDLSYYEDEYVRYYANIVAKYSKMVQKAMQKLQDIQVKIIAPTHGLIWRNNIEKIISDYLRWSSYQTEEGVVIAFGSMYGNTEKMADIIARRLSENGIKKIRVFDTSKTHISYILQEIWKFKGLIVGSSAYNADLFPTMENLMIKLQHNELQDRIFASFGSSGWNKAGVKGLNRFINENKWEVIAPSAETKCSPDEEAINQCLKIADEMSKRLKEIFPK